MSSKEDDRPDLGADAFGAAMHRPWKRGTARPTIEQTPSDQPTDNLLSSTGLRSVFRRCAARSKCYENMSKPWLDYLRQELQNIRREEENTNTGTNEKPADPRLAR